MSEHFRQGLEWDCASMNKRMDNLESERDGLKESLKELQLDFKGVVEDRDELKAQLEDNAVSRALFDKIEKDRDRLKAELEKHDKDHVRIESELVIERNQWKAKSARLAEAVKKIANRWFDPSKEEYVCSNCDGGMHAFADNRPEYHDDDCCYEIAKIALAEFEGTK